MGGDWRNWKRWKQWIREKGLEKWFRRDNLLILILGGILLVIIALPAKESSGDKKGGSSTEKEGLIWQPDQEEQETTGNGSMDGFPEDMSEEAYTAYLEERLTDVLEQIAGVGKVKVMVTLKSSRELVVEREETSVRSSTNESDAQGGSRESTQWENGESVIYRTDGNASEPYVIKTLKPEVEGVLVVAEGAGMGTINRTVTDIVQALFGVEAHKVKVVRMESE